MKLSKSVAIGVCLLISISSVQAQQTSDTTTKFTPPVIVKDSVQKSESKIKEYKSKQWKQGLDVMTDTTKGVGEKLKSGKNNNMKKLKRPTPPPPPPPAKP